MSHIIWICSKDTLSHAVMDFELQLCIPQMGFISNSSVAYKKSEALVAGHVPI